MIFRQAVAADLERAIEIMNAAIVRLGAAGVDQWQHGYPNAERLKSDVEEGIGYVLCDEDEVVAYGAMVFTGEPAYAEITDGEWLTSEGDYAVVHRMCVAEEYVGKGYGRRFMAEAERVAAQSKRSMRVDTHADNKVMQHLMPSMGYTYCGIIYFESRYLTAFEKILNPEI